jgi:hypothetical protein
MDDEAVEVIQGDRDAADACYNRLARIHSNVNCQFEHRQYLAPIFARHRLAFNAPPDGEREAFIAHIRAMIDQPAVPDSGGTLRTIDVNDLTEIIDRLSLSPHQGDREAIAREARLRMFLEILSAMGGDSDASESRYSWINAFCEPHEGVDPDTFNLAEQRGYTRVSHNSDAGHSTVSLTSQGRAWLLQAPPPTDEGVAGANAEAKGLYVASRATIPERSAMWRKLREQGVPINSTWIDEAGDGETACFTELWERITSEISRSAALILYAEASDFPLKGALTEAGIAIGMGKQVAVVTPGVTYEARSMRPIGSWVSHPLVTRFDTVEDALAALPTPQIGPLE